MTTPDISSVAKAIKTAQDALVRRNLMETDIRLQVYDDGSWTLHTGDACYDTDHSGAWGAATLSVSDTAYYAIAQDMIAQLGDYE